MSIIITIGREFGSGGRELGRRLAEELGIEYYDKEIIDAIIADEVTAELLADICLYWFEKESHGIFTGLTPKEVDTVRSDLAKELNSLASSFARFSKIMSDDSRSDFDKLCLMTNELIDMGLASKTNKTKEKIKSDSERINDMMRKLGF